MAITRSLEPSSNAVASSLKLAAVGDQDAMRRTPVRGAAQLDGPDDFHALLHRAKDHMLVVKPFSLGGAQEKLRAIGARARVGH